MLLETCEETVKCAQRELTLRAASAPLCDEEGSSGGGRGGGGGAEQGASRPSPLGADDLLPLLVFVVVPVPDILMAVVFAVALVFVCHGHAEMTAALPLVVVLVFVLALVLVVLVVEFVVVSGVCIPVIVAFVEVVRLLE